MSVTKVSDSMRDTTTLDATKLSGNLPAVSGANLTALNASNLGSGTVPTARLGSGTANSTVHLRGDGTWAEAGGGKVLQVVSVTKTDTFTTTNSAFTDVTGLTVSITPASSSNKVFVIASVVMGCTVGSEKTSWRLMRGSTAIHIGGSSGNRTLQTVQWQSSHATSVIMNTCNILDSPSTSSAVAYHVEGMAQDTSGSMCVNRSGTWADSQEYGQYASTITAMEIGA